MKHHNTYTWRYTHTWIAQTFARETLNSTHSVRSWWQVAIATDNSHLFRLRFPICHSITHSTAYTNYTSSKLRSTVFLLLLDRTLRQLSTRIWPPWLLQKRLLWTSTWRMSGRPVLSRLRNLLAGGTVANRNSLRNANEVNNRTTIFSFIYLTLCDKSCVIIIN